VELKQQGVQAQGHNVTLTKTSLAFQTIQTFYAILFLRQSADVQQQQIDALNEHLVITRKKVQAGTATDFDLLTTQVRIAAARNRRFDILNNLRKQEATFRQLLGLSPDAGIRLRGEFYSAPVPLTIDSLMHVALNQRTELKQARDEEKVAELQERVASSRDMPTVKVNLAYGVKNGYIPNLEVLRGNWVVGLDVDVPIFNGFRTRADEDEALAGRLASEARTSDVERRVRAEVEQAVSDVRTSADKIETSTLQVDQAKQALDIATVRYESGVVTNLDLIDAETALAQARLGHLQALFDYVISSTRLDRAVGNPLF
jgi:outer membrane protein